jgi:hypothetical protein
MWVVAGSPFHGPDIRLQQEVIDGCFRKLAWARDVVARY